jgi:hypothetical protein
LGSKELPQKVSGFNGGSSVLVDKEWVGQLVFPGVDALSLAAKATQGATRLGGNHDVILGLPWMKEHNFHWL